MHGQCETEAPAPRAGIGTLRQNLEEPSGLAESSQLVSQGRLVGSRETHEPHSWLLDVDANAEGLGHQGLSPAHECQREDGVRPERLCLGEQRHWGGAGSQA